MTDYAEEKRLRTAMFERWLKLMLNRRCDERRLDCAITFLESPPDSCETPQREESRALSLSAVVETEQGTGSSTDFLNEGILRVPVPDSGRGDGQGGRDSHRYLQFAFMKQTFYMDLPKNTLWPDEARRLLSQRSDFIYLGDRRFPWMSLDAWREMVHTWAPVQKEYSNSDPRTAAEDMAFILFTLWRFPLDWQFYRRALVFNRRKKRDWEGEGPVV
jgi:hypothetical protein